MMGAAPRWSPTRAGALLALAFVACVAWGAAGLAAATLEGAGGFTEEKIDLAGPAGPWGKTVGDLDGDGLPDLVVGGHEPPQALLWRRVLHKLHVRHYDWPTHGQLVYRGSRDHRWHVVSTQHDIRTDIEVADVDGDGRADVVAVTDQGIVWFKAPEWRATVIDKRVMHDLEIADFDGDGRLDIVARSQHLFGRADGDWLHFYRQQGPGSWQHHGFQVNPDPVLDFRGEGLKVADIDGDGHPDVVINQAWFRNPGDLRDPRAWDRVPYCEAWKWPHAYIDVADLNHDGRPDIVMAPAEPARGRYRLSWCEAPSERGGLWTEHVIDPQVETVMHGVAVGDLDGDGRLAVVTASMHVATAGRGEIAVYRPAAGQQPWLRTVIGIGGSHSIKLADVDGDGDLDVFGANYEGPDQRVRLWRNDAVARTAAGWQRHVVDDSRPWPSVFVLAADLDGDGKPDLVSGDRWYRNPGQVGAPWIRATVGRGANNAALAADFDGDGHVDILASAWNGDPDWTWPGRLRRWSGMKVDGSPGGLVWARNDGHGHFTVEGGIPPGRGDFLQGAALLRGAGGDRVVLSWHGEGAGVQQLRVPPGARSPWHRSVLQTLSQDEDLQAADLDGDGRADLVLGTFWLRQAADGSFTPHALRDPPGKPDRNRVGDIDGDGRPDVVVGFEAISRPGVVAWYRSGADPTRPWTEHVVGRFTGPMSLSLTDMDGDGDLDIVVGEHDLQHPARARLLWLENVRGDGSAWATHVIHTGDEHHDGALVVDLDQDGDLDVVSIGWGHGRLLVYENLAHRRTPPPSSPSKD